MLIRTKIKVPSLGSNLLFRKDLIKQLNASKGYPFVFLTGPAGSGKTSLVCQWLKKENFSVAWYSLDQEDNEPDVFFRYLLAAFVEVDPSFNETIGPMLGNPQQLSGNLVIPLIIESLSGADRRIHLILDDFHHVNNEEILNTLARLMQYMPASLRLVVLSRYRLPATMDAVAIKMERLEIPAADLKFSDSETVDLFKNIITPPISDDMIRELNQYVEGWAAGLQLIGLDVKSKGIEFDLSNIINQAHEQITSYLIHDILSMQPEEIRSFIFVTALLDRFNPELCEEVTGQKEAIKILLRISRLNLFLVPLDTDGRWYRYHHMFSEVVRRQVALNDPDLVAKVLHKAAKWFAANRLIEDAMRSAFRSGDFDFAADLMEDHVFQYVEQLNPRGGLRWILRLPSDILNQRVLLRLYQCQILMILMEFSQLKGILKDIENGSSEDLKRYSAEKQTLCKDYTIFQKCSLGILNTETSEEITQFKALSKKISAQGSFFLGGLELNLVYNSMIRGELSQAEDSLVKLSERKKSTPLLIGRIFVDKAKASIARLRGRLHQAEAIINQVHQDLDNQLMSNTPLAFVLHRHLGYIFYLQNKLPEAKRCLTMAVRYSEYSDLIDQVTTGNELRLLLYLSAGEKDRVAEYFKQLRSYSLKFDVPNFTKGLDACVARMAIDQQNIAPAVLWSKKRNIEPDEPFSLLYAMECQTQVRLLYAQKAYSRALSLLERLRTRCIKRELLELVLHIDILQSAIYRALDDNESAKSLLMEALAFSEREGYVRPFVNDAEHIAPVLNQISKELPDTALSTHLENIFTACRIPFGQSEWQSHNESLEYADLTKREIEILEWMAKGAKNKEISQKEFISISTVKTHVHRILNKLGVQTRTQAIIKAKEMNIIQNS